MSFGVFGHLLHFGFIEIARTLNSYALFFASPFVFSSNVQNTVGINVKGHLNLRHTARSRWNTVEYETAQALIAFNHIAFALPNVNFYLMLIVSSRTKDF